MIKRRGALTPMLGWTVLGRAILGWTVLGWTMLAWGGLVGAAEVSGGFCYNSGGLLGDNLYPANGSFGTASTTAKTYGSALPAGVTTLRYINGTSYTSIYNPGAPENGQYTISNTTKLRGDNNWWTSPDHTSGDYKGMMMVINADTNANTFYHQNFTVTPNNDYEFGLWIMNMLAKANTGTIPLLPNINIKMVRKHGDTILETITIVNTGDIPMTAAPTWKSYGTVVNVGNADNVDIDFLNQAVGGEGNDLAIDDLMFAPCKPRADVQVVKTQSLTNAANTFGTSDITQDMGQPFYYTLTLSNAGPKAANGSVMTDTVPPNLTSVSIVSTTPSAGTVCTSALSGNVLTATASTLPSGGSCQVTLSAQSVVTGTFSNSATVTPPATVGDPNLANNAAGPIKVTILDKPDISLVKTVRTLGPQSNLNLNAAFGDQSLALPGDVVEYCITASNAAGRSAARNVTINDPLASTLTAWPDGYGTVSGVAQGIQLQRTVGGAVTTLSSAADTDDGTLSALPAGGGNLTVRVGTIKGGDSARVCFRGLVR